jgi:hypothetical protein
MSVSASLIRALEKDEIDAELMLARSMRGLDASRDSKRITEQAIAG